MTPPTTAITTSATVMIISPVLESDEEVD
jgi:hypothetical protein